MVLQLYTCYTSRVCFGFVVQAAGEKKRSCCTGRSLAHRRLLQQQQHQKKQQSGLQSWRKGFLLSSLEERSHHQHHQQQQWLPLAAVQCAPSPPRANMMMSDAVVNGLAGACGGIVAQLLTYPLQAVNTRQHIERKTRDNGDLGVGDPNLLGFPSKSKPTKGGGGGGTLEEICEVIKQEGWEGLYRGLGPSLVGTACSQGVYYFFYHTFKNEAEIRAQRNKKLGRGDGSVSMLTSLLIAALAGCANVLLTNPIWVVVTRMQLSKRTAAMLAAASLSTISSSSSISSTPDAALAIVSQYGVLETVKDLYNEAGLLGLWKGVLPTLIMVSNPSIQFMIYESLLKRLTAKCTANEQGLKHVSAIQVFLLGAIAKLGATVLTYPLLVVKSRLQAKQTIGLDNSLYYLGTVDAVMKILHYEGVAGFYKGMGTKIVQSVVAAAVLFMIKEELVKAARAILAKGIKIPKAAVTT